LKCRIGKEERRERLEIILYRVLSHGRTKRFQARELGKGREEGSAGGGGRNFQFRKGEDER